MILTDEMNKVLDIVQNTDENIFVTGKAGSGKTTFLKYLIENVKTKNCIVTAPTGVAAINAGGVTLHSLFGLPFGPIGPHDTLDFKFTERKIEMLLNLDVLIIDEISMVRPDVLDAVDRKLRWVREDQAPFGGVQIIMFGDLYQLPPVVRAEDKKILDLYYNDYYFFNALVWNRTSFHVVELTKIFRQSDPVFVQVLNHIRNYEVTPEDLDILAELRDKKFSKDMDSGFIHVCSYRRTVCEINTEKLGKPTHTFEASFKGNFSESSAPCEKNLQLRVGARVMTLVNNPQAGYYNGTVGTVMAINDKGVTVKLDRGITVDVEKYTWRNNRYVLKDDHVVTEEVGSCTQFPLLLAWAITIHKSQGLTFDKIVLHVDRTFCPGQLYVALSRCTSLEGIVSNAFITKNMIIPEYALLDFEKTCRHNHQRYGRIGKTEK